MPREKAIDKLSDSEVLALSLWITARPRSWRRDLVAAFEVSGQGVTGYTSELQRIRNRLGASFLARLDTAEVLKAGEAVARARAGK